MIRKTAALLALTLLSTAAFGHSGHEHVSGFAAGFAHPFDGLDHLLAMVALGIWAAQWKGRSILIAPALFLSSMLVGALFAFNGGNLPFVEFGIASSVLAIGLLIAVVPAKGFGATLALPAVALGAAMHGYAHGSELPAAADALQYIAGFTVATALLHATGIGLGAGLEKRQRLRRAAGVLIVIVGSALALG